VDGHLGRPAQEHPAARLLELDAQEGRAIRAKSGVLDLGEGVREEALRERLVEGEPPLADLIDGDDHGAGRKRART